MSDITRLQLLKLTGLFMAARYDRAAPPHRDAALLEACSAFDALERAYQATDFRAKPGSLQARAADAERERITDLQDPLVAQMCELRAVTKEGQSARARSLALWDSEMMMGGEADTGSCLTAAIVRDLMD